MRRSVNVLIPAIALVACWSAAVAGVDWPGFRGPRSDGSVPDARLFKNDDAAISVGWKRALGSGYSALAVGDGRVLTMFAAGENDVLAAFDVESGDEIWRYVVDKTYAGHDGSHDGPISTPLLAGDRVYGLGPRGHLFALDAADGSPVWTTHLVDDHGAKKPHYGFSTAPVLIDGTLVVEIGGGEGKAIAGFDAEDGTLRWSLGDDQIDYQSPVPVVIGGRLQVMAAGGKTVYGIDAASGTALWSYEHGGDERAMGGATIVPVPAGDDRFLLVNKIDSSVMLRVTKSAEDLYEVEELWSNNSIRGTYVTPVYHDGYLYGMNGRIFICVDATTGEIAWRSREPGDGFPTVVGDHLVIITKPGSLHVARATPEGYQELSRLDLFDEHSWSEVAYAGGHLFARSMGHLARIDTGTAGEGDGEGSWIAGTRFGRFLEQVAAAEDKAALIDAFLEEQQEFPIIEGSDVVHFVHRSEAEDVGIVGDMIGFRREDPMQHVAGTDLFHYSMRLEPDAAVAYGFIEDYADEAIPDPRNPRGMEGLFGEVSFFSMPAWAAPDFVDTAPRKRQGRMESVEWVSEVREGATRKAGVYLPAGYDADGDRRYPVAYVHAGKEALEQGSMKNSLDQLIGKRIDPLIAVFIYIDEENRRDLGEGYLEMVISELVPLIDERFKTIPDPPARASIGAGGAGRVAVVSAFEHSDIFGRIGGHSAIVGADDIREAVRGAGEQPLVIYLDWGTYHMRSPHEAWDLAVENRELWALLRERGYRPAGGEVPEGFGWLCWRAHTDELLSALFPLGRGPA